MKPYRDQFDQEDYRDIIDNASDLIQCVDQAGSFLYVNRAWKKKLGYSDRDLQDLTLWDIIHPQSLEHCHSTFKQVLADKSASTIQAVFLTKKGEAVHVEGNVNCRCDSDGNVASTRAIFRDLSARLLKEEMLRASEEKYRLIFEQAPLGIVHIDTKGSITDCNNVFVQIIGSSREALIGLNVLKLPDRRMVGVIKKALKGSISAFEGTYKSITADKITKLKGTFAPVSLSSGTISGAIGIIEDISEQKKYEEQLLAGEAMQQLLTHMATGFINLPLKDLDQALSTMLGSIGNFVKADRAYIFLHDHERQISANTNEWCADNVSPVIEIMQNIPFDAVSDILDIHNRGETLYIPDANSSKLSPALKDFMDKQMVKSLILLPIILEGANAGFVGLDAVKETKEFSEKEIAILRVLAEIIANTLSRQQTEKQLADNENYIRSIVDLIPDLIFIYDQDGTYLDTVSSTEELLYAGRKNMIGKTIAETLPEALAPRLLEAIRNTLKSRTLQVIEYQLEVPAGRLWFEARLLPSGEDRVMAVVRDITAGKKAEIELKESRDQYQSLIDNIPGISYRCLRDKDWTMIYMSDDVETVTGYPASDFIKNKIRTYQSIIHPMDDKNNLLIKKALEAGKPWDIEYRIIHKKGSVRWAHEKGRGVCDESGDLKYLDGLILDVTERKKIEASLAYRLEFEKMLAEISFKFVNTPPNMLDQAVTYALEKAGIFFGADRSYVIRFSDDGTRYSETHEWCAEGIKSQFELNQNVSIDEKPWWVEQLKKKKAVNIPKVVKLPPEAEQDKKEFVNEGIKSILTIPMKWKGKLFGFLGLETVIETRFWSVEQVALLKVVAELMISAFRQKMAEDKILRLSYQDQLTGLYNRRYLETEMERYDTDRQLPLSVIMADLNGLKVVNDTYGHAKGDLMLKKAALILRESCRNEDLISRWGGDEFLILLPQTTESEAGTICNRITENCRNQHVEDIPLSIALGFATREKLTKSIHRTVSEADNAMYQHKLASRESGKN